jgi:hypothetical protein
MSSRQVRLCDGSTGFLVQTGDDCWAAAVATVLQVPLDDLPRARIDERLRRGESPIEIDRSVRCEFDAWLAARRLRMVLHRTVPVDSERWIGVVPLKGSFQSHCLVMNKSELLFDPANLAGPNRLQELIYGPFGLNVDLLEVAALALKPVGRARGVRIWGPGDVRYGYTFEKRS